jgi:Holliday junction resolvasome RuvABC endonuclease subunit
MIIAIDQSLTNTAVAVIKDGRLLEVLNIKPNILTWHHRMMKIIGDIEGVYERYVREYPEEEIELFMESYAYAGSQKAFVLGELGGIIKFQFVLRHGKLVRQANIQHIKMFITGKGNAKKPEMIEQLRIKFGYEAANDNEADAIAIGLLMWHAVEGISANDYSKYQMNLFQRALAYSNGVKLTPKKKKKAKKKHIVLEDDPFKVEA